MKKYNTETLRYMTLFSKVTRVMPIECFTANSHIIFVLKKGEAGKAIGSGGKRIKQIKNSLKKDIKVIEEADSPENLVMSYLFPIKPRKVELEEENSDKIIVIMFKTRGERQTLLGNNKQGLRVIKEVINHFYPDISDIKIP